MYICGGIPEEKLIQPEEEENRKTGKKPKEK